MKARTDAVRNRSGECKRMRRRADTGAPYFGRKGVHHVRKVRCGLRIG